MDVAWLKHEKIKIYYFIKKLSDSVTSSDFKYYCAIFLY
jgi:hypothetical protein